MVKADKKTIKKHLVFQKYPKNLEKSEAISRLKTKITY